MGNGATPERRNRSINQGEKGLTMEKRKVTFHFENGETLAVEFPKQAGDDASTAMGNVRKALESDRIQLEVKGELIVILLANVNYIWITPAPEALPTGIIRGARVISQKPAARTGSTGDRISLD
jgi:hypothetical protein